MIGRRQLTVASPISAIGLGAAFAGALRDPRRSAVGVQRRVRDAFGVREAVLTDSGTSALILALRLAAPNGGTVAYPGYACVDLAAAARFAGVKVRLYDLDPSTLSPDLDSVRGVFSRGVDAIVVAHLFGYPADVPAVCALAAETRTAVIEDAAQGAGAVLRGRRLGSIGDLGIASFGRGKGLCAGGGGALMAQADPWASHVRELSLADAGRGWSALAKTGVQWVLGRPALYAIPATIPWLRLGQMVYHPAHEPRAMESGSIGLLPSALALEPEDLAARRANAAALERIALGGGALAPIRPIEGAEPGYLRYAARALCGAPVVDAALGLARPYPVTMREMPELQPVLAADEPPTPGADALRDSLITLPSHRFVTAKDLGALERWMSSLNRERRARGL